MVLFLLETKDVLNMQLNPDTGKLVVVAGSFSGFSQKKKKILKKLNFISTDIIDCTIFYVNISDQFVNEMIYTHLYFCSTKKLLNALKAHFLNTQKLITQSTTPDEKKSATKVMDQGKSESLV